MSGRLSEREKIYYIMILFPIFWPFIPGVVLCDLIQSAIDWWASKRARSETHDSR